MMTTDPRLMAVHESVHVGCPVEEAFALFTTGMGEWWPLDKASYGGDRAKDIFLEPHVGGRFFERFVDGDELQVGTVVVCEPPWRIIFTWTTADWEGETEVEVTFTPQDDGTRSRSITPRLRPHWPTRYRRRREVPRRLAPESCTLSSSEVNEATDMRTSTARE